MIQILLISVLALAALGFLAGLGLALASEKFKVIEDPRIDKINSMLPGANCGACGYPGCRGFAEAVVAGKVDPSGCLFGGKEVTKLVAWVMGAEERDRDPQSAFLLCGGGKSKTQERFEYKGVPTCRAANALGGGFKSCSYGCLSYGDCVKVCPVDAIQMSADGLPIVDVEKCIACGKCLKECPRDLFVLLPKKITYHINCHSNDKGAVSRKACQVSCIACRICEKKCPTQAITIENNLAVIDQSKCINCAACFEACPTKCIVQFKAK